jgi:hypothetical protein
MNRPPLHLTRPGQLPRTCHRRRQHARSSPTRSTTSPSSAPPAGPATPPSGCTPSPASSPRPNSSWPQAVHDARDQELTRTQIGELLNTTAATAARRYRSKT